MFTCQYRAEFLRAIWLKEYIIDRYDGIFSIFHSQLRHFFLILYTLIKLNWVNRYFLSTDSSSVLRYLYLNTAWWTISFWVYFFRMFGMCRTCSSEWSGTEHSARTNRTVCGVYHVLRWCRRNQDGGTDYLFFYIEFLYTLLIFLELRNTKEMRGFFRGEEGLCKLWIQSTIVL